MTPEEQETYRLNGASEVEAEAWAALDGGIEAWRGIAKVCMALGREVVAQRGRIADLDKRLADLERQQGDGR